MCIPKTIDPVCQTTLETGISSCIFQRCTENSLCQTLFDIRYFTDPKNIKSAIVLVCLCLMNNMIKQHFYLFLLACLLQIAFCTNVQSYYPTELSSCCSLKELFILRTYISDLSPPFPWVLIYLIRFWEVILCLIVFVIHYNF